MDAPDGSARRDDGDESVECTPTFRVHVSDERSRHVSIPVPM